MPEEILEATVKEQALAAMPVEIVAGIPSYNNARTIGHVVQAVHRGMLKYFPDRRGLIVNSDGGSIDGTAEVVLQSKLDSRPLLSVSHPLYPVNRLTIPYHGVPGKGSAFRTLFRVAELVQARALVVVDADLRSITPEWVDLLARPVLEGEFDYVTPYYRRHKYDGTITSSIVYPLTRALFGRRVRQPMGGECGVSGRLARRFLSADVWSSDVARYGIDIWMTTTAIAENFRVCQSYLGAKIHDPKDPGADLGSLLVQVVGSVFSLMENYASVWQNVLGSLPAPLLGSPFDVDLEPVPLDSERMLSAYQQGCRDLMSIYQQFLSPELIEGLSRCAVLPTREFSIPDDLWVGVIYDFTLAYHRRVMDTEHLLKSLMPLYLGWVASFCRQTERETPAQVEDRIERLCLVYEQLKSYLINQWSLRTGEKRSQP